MIEKLYTCKYCGAKFAKEKTLTVHMCEQKRRFTQKDERRVQLGYQTFVRFYELCQKSSKPKTNSKTQKKQNGWSWSQRHAS